MKRRRTSLDLVKPLFREWGRQGGKKRAQKLSPAERREIARRGGLARWNKIKRSTQKSA